MTSTLYWHDYETFGVDPRRDRPAQFAGLRTDEDLNEIGEPLVIYCQPARDVLPHPEACLLTGITPQLAAAEGLIEPEFIALIHAELAQASTCGVGYNTLRFDDEVTRFTLYRNFFEPYAREWQNGNSRWDLIDLVRMTYALRPEGIEWPRHEDGRPSFRLEELTQANGIGHASAHDALSDVRATIDLARLLRQRQPRLYDWLFQLRNKRKVAELLDLHGHEAVLHTSSMYPAETACTTLVMPMIAEPGNNNSVLVYDLRHDPQAFMELDETALQQRLFTRREEMPEGMERLPVKSVKINKCPALAPRKTLDDAAIARLAIDLGACDRHWQLLHDNQEFMQRVAQAYSSREFSASGDVDLALYDGFLNNADNGLLAQVRESSPQALSQSVFDFKDARLPELLFRYRARNWPQTLSTGETQQWQGYCQHRLKEGTGGDSMTLSDYDALITHLQHEREGDAVAQKILADLLAWGETLQCVISE